MIAAAKAKPDGVTYGSIGSGSLGHLTMVLLAQRAGVKMVHVPYRGGGPLMNDALAGHVDLAIGSAALITPQVKGGKLRGHRADRRQARPRPAGRADRDRKRTSGLRVLRLVGLVHGRQDAAADRRALQQGADRER